MLATLVQAAAIVTLWQSRRFDTHDIAQALGVSEPLVCKVLDEVRNYGRKPDLYLVGEPA
jgi:hypothetical protein